MLRKLKSSDREELSDLINSIDHFSDEEKDVAVELIDEALDDPGQDYYNIFVYEEDGKVVGYHCTGRRALTDGVYDLYWIVVNPSNQNAGIGEKLLEHAEQFVKENKGRWLLVETSSRDDYLSIRKFYLRNSYSIVSEINDFYSVGDNLIVFGKYLQK